MTDRTHVTTRRALLRGAALTGAAAAAAGLVPAAVVASSSTDPVLVLAAAVEIKRSAVTAASDAVAAIWDAAEKAAGVGPMPGGNDEAAMEARHARNGETDAAMDRLGLREAFNAAEAEEERAVDDFCCLQADLGYTEATTFAGVVARLRYVAECAVHRQPMAGDLDHHEHALFGAIADIERLAAGEAVQS